jgi:cation:H+ antiporter
MIMFRFFIYVLSFIGIWFGAGLIVSAVSTFSRKLRLSQFAFSFVFLGILTSAPEFSVGLQSVSNDNPEIFIGNLLGGTVIMFLVVIPLLAIFGNGINLRHELDKHTLPAALAVILAPAVFTLDMKITVIEGYILILLYVVLLYLVEKKNGIFDRSNSELLDVKSYFHKNIIVTLAGIGIVFISSNSIVSNTEYFANIFQIPAFYIGLLIVAMGTALPELSLVLRSVMNGKKDVAMGDYIGASAFNTFMFGFFTVLHKGEILTVNSFSGTFLFITIALLFFYIISIRKRFITRANGFFLLAVYALFILYELSIIPALL